MRAAASLDMLARWDLGYKFACQESWAQEEEREQRKEGISGELRRQRQEGSRGESGEEKEDTAASLPGEFVQQQTEPSTRHETEQQAGSWRREKGGSRGGRAASSKEEQGEICVKRLSGRACAKSGE